MPCHAAPLASPSCKNQRFLFFGVDIFIPRVYNNAKVMIEVADVISMFRFPAGTGEQKGTSAEGSAGCLTKADTWGCREYLLHCRCAESYHDAAWISC